MTDQLPGDGDDMRAKAAGGVAGYRGERAQDRSADDPDLRREVDTIDGPVQVEDSSGSEHVEATGEAGLAEEGDAAPPPERAAPPTAKTPAVDPPHAATSRLGVGLAAVAGIGAAAYLARAMTRRSSH